MENASNFGILEKLLLPPSLQAMRERGRGDSRGRGRGGGRGRGRESAASATAHTEVRGTVARCCFPTLPHQTLLVGRRRRASASTQMRAGSSLRAATRRESSGSTTQHSHIPNSTRARPRCGATPPCSCSCPRVVTTLAPSCQLLCMHSATALPASDACGAR